MRNFILATAAIVAISFAASTAKADHFHHRHLYRHHGHVRHHVAVPHHVYRHHVPVPHHVYRHHVPVYSGYHGYRSHQVYHHNYHYARPGYYGGGVAIGGPHFSFRVGF